MRTREGDKSRVTVYNMKNKKWGTFGRGAGAGVGIQWGGSVVEVRAREGRG